MLFVFLIRITMAAAGQPDFHAMSGAFALLGEQIRRCEHLPAIEGGGAILEAIASLRLLVERIDANVAALSIRGLAKYALLCCICILTH